MDLEKNQITDKSLDYLISFHKYNEYLKELNLKDNLIDFSLGSNYTKL